MLNVNIIDVIGAVATVAIMSSAVPQGVKVLLRKNADGVSLAMWYISITLNVALFMYGTASEYFAVAVGGVVNSIAAAVLATIITYYSDRRKTMFPFGYLLSLTCVAFLVNFLAHNSIPATVYLFIAAVSLALNALPQLLKSWKNFTKRHPTEVSLFTFSLLLSGQTLWTVYSVIQKDAPLAFVNLTSALLTTSIITLEVLNKNNSTTLREQQKSTKG